MSFFLTLLNGIFFHYLGFFIFLNSCKLSNCSVLQQEVSQLTSTSTVLCEINIHIYVVLNH